MAKKLIKNYTFTPGLGLSNNLHPNAITLITQNKNFIIKEIIAYIQDQVDGAEKCERDIGYLVDGVRFDVALGTNYNAIFLGLAEYNSLEFDYGVILAIERARALVLDAITGTTAEARANAFFDEILDIGSNGRSAANVLSFPNPTGASSNAINAKTRLVNNRDFFAAEVNAWVASNFPSADHDAAKCSRDVKYAVDALCYDAIYGGNSATYDQARFFFYGFANGSPGIDPTHRTTTVAAYGRLKTIVGQVVRGETVTRSTGNTVLQNTDGGNTDNTTATTLENLVQITADVVNQTSQSDALLYLSSVTRTEPSITWASVEVQTASSLIAAAKTSIKTLSVGYTGYVYDTAKCERDSGYVIDALIFDVRYGGNEKTRYVSSQYWDGDVAQIDGNRIPEYDAYQWTAYIINTFILTNTLNPHPMQTVVTQYRNTDLVVEAGATARVSTLLGSLISVIVNGLSSLPVENIQLNRIEILGKVELEDLLLISNVTANAVIYNFAEPSLGATLEFFEGNTPNWPQATTVNNGVTFIRVKTNCSDMTSGDAIQIFLENTELRVRPYDFGTDAIERMRVAQPQAMIDADFEYGLQPTKWQAIGMQRGYPATYEVSATDVPVSTVTTDASTGSSGIGASLITVTTQSAHGFSAGQPITIRALAASIVGFNRAEGTFIIFDVPTTRTFRYYAKAKVGTSNGQILATTTTQLREADFYTGASVGQPTFAVLSNGSSGAFTTELQTPSGQNTLVFVGSPPPIGAPLSATGIAVGTQVSGVFGDANSDGVQDYRYVKTTVSSGVSAIAITDTSDIEAGMAVGNGASPNIMLEVSSIVGQTLNLSGPITVAYQGDENIYTGGAIAIVGTGGGATFNIDIVGNSYSIASINTAGSGYAVGDTLKAIGSSLGGDDVTNDCYITVRAVNGSGGITQGLVTSGTGTIDASYTNVPAAQVGSLGSGAVWTVVRANGVYTVTSYGSNPTSGYYEGNKFRIPGSNFEGTDGVNDCTITIGFGLGSLSDVNNISASGTVRRGDQIPIYATVALSQAVTANIPAATNVTYSAIATFEITFANNHGFVPGMGLNIAISSSGSNHQLAAGPLSVENVPALNKIRYTARSAGTVDTLTTLEGTVYVRPDSFFTHRPFDGGVMLGTGGPQHGGQAIRQSKKYIRYQSGKGAMYNTGALFAPSYDVQSVTASSTASGATITIVTDDVDHGAQAGAVVRLSGTETTGYNGDYTVTEIVDERTLRVVAGVQLGSTTGTLGSQCQLAVLNWHGAVVRSGPFDDQNGIFWQYNGRELAVGRRTSTFQIAGTIAMTQNSNQVVGTNTRFADQLTEGDRIVIRGMTHVVANIASNTSMTVTPDWRGVNAITGVKCAKIQDLIIPQSEWNLDKCDGTGPSGYNIDVTKMQMIGIQFSWYGAGFIDWMLRGPNGDYLFVHRLKGNNLNTEAYMRTGNLPVRYEVQNEGARNKLKESMTDSQNFMVLNDVRDFPNSGTVYVDNEIITYSGRNTATNRLTGLTRSATLSNFAAGATRSYLAGAAATHSAGRGVVLISNTVSPIISHWGSAYLIDGLFDEDRGYIFSYTSSGNSISTTKNTVFLIRLAPSVSNAVVGDLGERELLNRAQLLLKSISITSDAMTTGASGIVIEGVLNPQNYPINPSDIGWQGLTGLSAGGQPSFAQIAPGGSVVWSSGASETTATATTTTTMTANLTSLYSSGRNTYMYITQASWEASGAFNPGNFQSVKAGVVINDAKFSAGTTITSVQGPLGSPAYYFMNLSRAPNSNVNSGNTVTLNLGGNSATNTSLLYFTQATWESSGARTNTEVSDVKFPANTRVATVTGPTTFGATTYYAVTFTQSSNTLVSAGGTITFKFGQPPYALPGETVFSFIANPGETATLELDELKELTTTAIGGRGAFPNGPDVMAINVYKTSGDATTANIILRWGEAQA
jgi:hypothetical protein